tara:strand:+ start:9454 stop:12012 length:2559 start_codon:yes stop_codon:yes gene_type:complete
MGQHRVLLAITAVSMLLLVPAIQGYQNGVYNQASGCGCHSQTGTTPASVGISGLPSSYDVNKLYQITVSVSGGVSGSNGGFSLEVDKGVLSTPQVGFGSVKVNSQGNSATHGVTGSSYRSWSFDWTSPSAGAGTTTFEVAGITANGNGGTSGDRWATYVVQVPENVPVNNPPSASNVLLAPTDAKTTDVLTLSYSYSDPDGDAQSGTEITWYRDSQALPQGTISGLSVPTSETLKGQEWYATVKPSDGSDFGSLVTSNVVTIENTAPSLSTPSITPSAADESDDLTVSYTASDDDQEPLVIEIKWYLDGVLISEFENDTTIPSIATREGDEWRVEVTVSDGEDFVSSSSQIITIGEVFQPNNPPEISSLVILPNQPTTVDNLDLLYTAQDLDGDSIIDIEIEWRVDDVLTTETSTTVESTQTSKGQIWEVQVRVSDGKDWSNWSELSSIIVNSPPVVESVTYSPSEIYTDDSITVTYDYTDLDNDLSTNPQIIWSKNGIEQAELSGLNPLPSSYTSKGEIWTVSLKANDGDSYSNTAVNASFSIQNSLPSIVIDTIPDNLSFANNDLIGLEINPQYFDADDDPIESSIQWLRNGFQEGSLDNSTLVPAELFGAGQSWTLTISYHDSDGPVQQFSKSIEVDNLPPSANFEIISTNLWRGEIIQLDASSSFDVDGVITNYLWQYQDSEGNQASATGQSVEIIGYGTIGMSLTVEDDLGLTATLNSIIVTTQGPIISELSAVNDDKEVLLTWQYSGDNAEFSILRNGEQIGTTTNQAFADEPLIAGPTSYTITPVVDGQQLIAGSMTISDFEVSITVEPASSVSETGGFILGIIFLLASFGVVTLSLIGRRNIHE